MSTKIVALIPELQRHNLMHAELERWNGSLIILKWLRSAGNYKLERYRFCKVLGEVWPRSPSELNGVSK
jgi:hypothetical protein